MDQIVEANLRRYKDGEIVDEYMREFYHRLRIKNALWMMEKECRKRNDIKISDTKVLEIAGATGIVSSRLIKKGYCVTLADISPEALKIARHRNRRLETIQMDATKKFPFNNNSFDVIFAADIIEHIFDTRLFLNECNRCLKPNGILVITTPNLASLQDRIRFLFGKSPRQVNPLHEYLYLHIRPFTYETLKHAMEDSGFTDFKLTTNMVKINLGKMQINLVLVGKLFPSIGRSLIVSAHSKA